MPTIVETRPRPRAFASELDRRDAELEATWEIDAAGQTPTRAVHDLIVRAREERESLSLLSPRRAYYVGVEAAAEQVLQPGLGWVRKVGWLDRFNPAFISGFVETTALLTPVWAWPTEEPAPDTRPS